MDSDAVTEVSRSPGEDAVQGRLGCIVKKPENFPDKAIAPRGASASDEEGVVYPADRGELAVPEGSPIGPNLGGSPGRPPPPLPYGVFSRVQRRDHAVILVLSGEDTNLCVGRAERPGA